MIAPARADLDTRTGYGDADLAIAGDVAGARQAYLDFLRLWKDADADLETFTAARQEYERLT